MPPNYTCSEVFVNFKNVLGSGSFGKVYKGRLNGEDVAVKVIKGDDWETTKEIRRMKKACASEHPNIIELLGTVSPSSHYCGTCHKQTRDITWLVMEYMENGNLLDYIWNYGGGMPAYGMIKIAYQVALGMDHLHRFCNLLHTDLAARNVLVQSNYHVKIGDFGLVRNYDYTDQYYVNNGYVCPVRWMPPENHPFPDTTSQPMYSRKGDVWSFGVLLFEIWTRGKNPFDGLGNYQVMQTVRAGKTVLNYQNVKARRWVIDLMKECFSYNKEDRPNFRQISTKIYDESEYNLEDDDDDEEEDECSSDDSY